VCIGRFTPGTTKHDEWTPGHSGHSDLPTVEPGLPAPIQFRHRHGENNHEPTGIQKHTINLCIESKMESCPQLSMLSMLSMAYINSKIS
jgi:hypothetical protein